jgi:hypothetical protein
LFSRRGKSELKTMTQAVSKRPWLKWALISMGAFLSLVVGAVVLLLFGASRPSSVEVIGDHWVLEHYHPWNPDGHYAKYLARRGALSNKTVSGEILDVPQTTAGLHGKPTKLADTGAQSFFFGGGGFSGVLRKPRESHRATPGRSQ